MRCILDASYRLFTGYINAIVEVIRVFIDLSLIQWIFSDCTLFILTHTIAVDCMGSIIFFSIYIGCIYNFTFKKQGT